MISIMGAGSAGLYSAYLLAKNNHEVGVFEQKREIGKPVQCTGIVTSKIKEIIDIKEGSVKNRIKKVEVNSNNNSAIINLKEPDLILDREKLDLFLAERAEKEGVKIFLQKKFIGIENGGAIIKDILNSKTENIKSEHIIGADGPLSSIYNIVNPEIKREYYMGMQIRAKGEFDKDTFKVYLGNVCPDFFAWVVPEDESIARVGLASRQNHKILLRDFLKKIGITKAIEIQAGLIPCYNPRIKTQKDNMYLLGDAASQLKASTGGGIVQGLIAAEALADSITNGKDYEKEWRKKLGKELWIHKNIRETMNKFNDHDYDKLVEMLKNDRLKKILEGESRDAPSKFGLRMILAEPRLMSFLGKMFSTKNNETFS